MKYYLDFCLTEILIPLLGHVILTGYRKSGRQTPGSAS